MNRVDLSHAYWSELENIQSSAEEAMRLGRLTDNSEKKRRASILGGTWASLNSQSETFLTDCAKPNSLAHKSAITHLSIIRQQLKQPTFWRLIPIFTNTPQQWSGGERHTLHHSCLFVNDLSIDSEVLFVARQFTQVHSSLSHLGVSIIGQADWL
jgi:hypothetical protein